MYRSFPSGRGLRPVPISLWSGAQRCKINDQGANYKGYSVLSIIFSPRPIYFLSSSVIFCSRTLPSHHKAGSYERLLVCSFQVEIESKSQHSPISIQIPLSPPLPIQFLFDQPVNTITNEPRPGKIPLTSGIDGSSSKTWIFLDQPLLVLGALRDERFKESWECRSRPSQVPAQGYPVPASAWS